LKRKEKVFKETGRYGIVTLRREVGKNMFPSAVLQLEAFGLFHRYEIY